MNNIKHLLLSLFLITGIGCWTVSITSRPAPHPDEKLMLAAATRTQQAYQKIYQRRLELQFQPDPINDPNLTGLIGPMFTGITTTQGLLEAKRTTTNPNSGALLVRLLLDAGVCPGDTVAVNLSGSFPAVNIALMCALEEMQVSGIIFSSIGASTYGATIPEFTYPDMELLLYEANIISQKSTYISMGGYQDLGSDMDPKLVAQIQERLQASGYKLLSLSNYDENLNFRFSYYIAQDISCFVNIGGNLLSFGGSDLMSHMRGGILTELPFGEQEDGLVQRFLIRGIPVVHLLGMKDIYASYGLPIDPIPLPSVGEGEVYVQTSYCWPLAVLFLIVDTCILWKYGRKRQVSKYLSSSS